MKIDCPHCGVHGSVEDSLARKKLRCPKCSKVFLVSDDVLPEADDGGLVPQEVLYDSEPQIFSETDEQLLAETDAVQESVEEAEAAAPEDDLLEILEEEASEQETGDSSVEEDELFESDDEREDEFERDEPLQEVCSVCGEKFHLDFLQEIDSKFYCGVCQPEVLEEITDEEGEEIAAEESEELTADAGEDLAAETLEKSKGAKGAVLALVVICAILLAVFFLGR